MSMKRRIAFVGTVAAAGMMLAACNDAGESAKPKSGPQVPVAATVAPGDRSSSAQGRNWKGWTVLTATNNDTLGRIVVDGKGFTLYRFNKDTPDPSVSNCFGACAKTWPPVKFTGKLKLKGIPRSAIGNIMTKDGVCQATINGWPIYRYSKDTAPGQINGQGVGGTWFAVAPDGKKAGGGKVPSGGDSGSYGY
jgi:predicted lipoprotein with Yx(FWY)xxD motif